MKLKLAILALALSTNLFAIDLDEGQLERITKVYKVSKLFKAKDGTTFEQAMSGIYLRESSAGIYNIGDKYEDKYYYKHTTNGKTSEIFIDKSDVKVDKDNGQLYYIYKKVNLEFYKKVFILEGQLKPISESSLGGHQIKLDTAKRVIIERNLIQYKAFLKSDKLLISRLMDDVIFSSIIAVNYVILCYEEALDRGYSNPYFRAISRYNGGWSNVDYYKAVESDIKELQPYLQHM